MRRRNWRRAALWLWAGAAAACLAAEPPRVPVVLGEGTGGSGAWSCFAAAHSPSTLRVDANAGPEATPAAVFEFRFSPTAYNWNWATVGTGGVDVSGFQALRVTYRTEVPAGFAPLNLMLRESSGASYWVPQALPLSPSRCRSVTVPFDRFSLPGWSSDANGRLDLALVTEVSIGLETGLGGSGRVVISDVELLPPGW